MIIEEEFPDMQSEDIRSIEYDEEILPVLEQGDREIEAGEGYSLEEVMQEADKLLAEDQP